MSYCNLKWRVVVVTIALMTLACHLVLLLIEATDFKQGTGICGYCIYSALVTLSEPKNMIRVLSAVRRHGHMHLVFT